MCIVLTTEKILLPFRNSLEPDSYFRNLIYQILLEVYDSFWEPCHFNPLIANPTKWPNTLKQFVDKLPANCLSVFSHFIKLALKGLKKKKIYWSKVELIFFRKKFRSHMIEDCKNLRENLQKDSKTEARKSHHSEKVHCTFKPNCTLEGAITSPKNHVIETNIVNIAHSKKKAEVIFNVEV